MTETSQSICIANQFYKMTKLALNGLTFSSFIRFIRFLFFFFFSESLRKMNVKSTVMYVYYYTRLVNCGFALCCLIFKCVYISMPENVNKIPNIRFDMILSLKKR